ncbi:hypothetical protein DL764_004523 [Monosporascus ibericus]|uniref:Uncharacterized protein n=1 Tax=Monosporascus ibericus TaxID=155417 RepID=A0A4Q4TFN1_9PEZI|nr:hypothetical protein DL764_004523 [Monosporascus ibericus]
MAPKRTRKPSAKVANAVEKRRATSSNTRDNNTHKAAVSKRLAAAKTAPKNKRKGKQQTVIPEAEDPEKSEIKVVTNTERDTGSAPEATDTKGDTGSAPKATDNEPSEDEALRNEPSEDEAFRNEPFEDEVLRNEPSKAALSENDAALNEDISAEAFKPRPLNIRAQFLNVIKVTVDGKPPKEQPNRIRNAIQIIDS